MKSVHRRCSLFSGFALILLFASAGALAQSPTLERISKNKEFRIGYRTDASPLSYENASGSPSGYSVDLCRRIAAAVKTHLGQDDIETTFVKVDTDNRFDAVENGDIDIECGSTTLTMGRQDQVDFTLMTFVTGGSVLALSDSAIGSLADLAGKKVGVSPGTTTLEKLREYLAENLVDAEIVTVADRAAGMEALNNKTIDAFASDQIVLIGQVIEALYPKRYSLVSETFSYEPYALMVPRNDSEFRMVANKALTQVYRSGQHIQIYNKWIGRIGIQPSPLLVAMYQLNILPE